MQILREKKLFLNNFSFFVKNFFIISILFVLSSCGGGGSGNTPDIPSVQPFVWEVVTPESQGLDSTKVQAAINFAMEDGKFTQAAIIIKNGKIVGEQYRGISSSEKTLIIDDAETNWTAENLDLGYATKDTNSLVTSWSVAKSYTSILFGIAQGMGFFPNGLETTAATYLTEWEGDERNTITLKKLLDMRSGLEPACYDALSSAWQVCTAVTIASGGGLTNATNQLIGCINRNLAATNQTHDWYRPGGQDGIVYQTGYFLYQNCDSMVLGEIFYRAVGQDIKTFADTYLFSKLNITADWWRDYSTGGQANGNYLSYCCLDMTARDFAKVALLLVNNGVWQGEQIIPQSYAQAIKNITTTSVVTEQFGGVQSYGLKFWSIYGASNCGPQNDQKCVPDNTVISPVGYDGQYMLMDFANNLIMIRFSLYAPIQQVSTDKKMIVAYPEPSNFILTLPIAATNPNPVSRFFPIAEYWYTLNN